MVFSLGFRRVQSYPHRHGVTRLHAAAGSHEDVLLLPSRPQGKGRPIAATAPCGPNLEEQTPGSGSSVISVASPQHRGP